MYRSLHIGLHMCIATDLYWRQHGYCNLVSHIGYTQGRWHCVVAGFGSNHLFTSLTKTHYFLLPLTETHWANSVTHCLRIKRESVEAANGVPAGSFCCIACWSLCQILRISMFSCKARPSTAVAISWLSTHFISAWKWRANWFLGVKVLLWHDDNSHDSRLLQHLIFWGFGWQTHAINIT